MPQLLERPQFIEGQILGADDLTQLLDYVRAAIARHERGLHLWGIARGLTVELREPDKAYVVYEGLAIDSSGAQLIVTEAIKLDPADLHDAVVLKESDHGEYFPVFLVAQRRAAASARLLGTCDTQGAPRIIDSVTVTYDRFALDWDVQAPVDADAGPDDSAQSQRKVLLGFVRYKDPQTPQEFRAFDDFQLEHNGIRPRFAGVRAGEVAASRGRLILRTRPAGQADAPMIVLDESNADEAFTFGVDNGRGRIKPVLRADTKGNLKAEGTVTGLLTTGQTLVQSGSATDGVKLPLPAGVTEQQVIDGSVALHIMVQPRLGALDQPLTRIPVASCSVDDDRRVSSVVHSIDPAGTQLTDVMEPGICDYLIIANVPSSKGDTK